MHLQQDVSKSSHSNNIFLYFIFRQLENIGGFSFQAVMSPAGLRRTHFVLRSSGEEGREVLRLSTRVGGLSGVLGEAEEGDDAEANASAELSLLGLPLRPYTLFSSMGEDKLPA